MVDIDECPLWPILCLVEFYRFYEDHTAGHVFPADRRPCQLHTFRFTSASWDVAEGGCVYGEFDPFLEAAAVQRQGRDLEAFGWSQVV